jgi:uridine kinase
MSEVPPRATESRYPPTIPWHLAPVEILRRARGNADAKRPILIGITGPVGSGKSTLARLISACIVPTDMYLPDYDDLPEHERDDPRHADLVKLAEDLRTLRAGKPAQIPVWSFHSHKRESTATLAPAEVIVCEGIHALQPIVAEVCDLAVLVIASSTTRWNRWEIQERSGVRGWGVEKARAYFHAVADPTFTRFEPDYRARADVLVHNDS